MCACAFFSHRRNKDTHTLKVMAQGFRLVVHIGAHPVPTLCYIYNMCVWNEKDMFISPKCSRERERLLDEYNL